MSAASGGRWERQPGGLSGEAGSDLSPLARKVLQAPLQGDCRTIERTGDVSSNGFSAETSDLHSVESRRLRLRNRFESVHGKSRLS